MTNRENYLRTVRFEYPDHIPVSIWISPACWHSYPQEFLFEMMETHKLLFPGYVWPAGSFTPDYASCGLAGKPYTDGWGCLWETATDGIVGIVKNHPLDDWSKFADYKAPNPDDYVNVAKEAEQIKAQKEAGEISIRTLTHGHTFLRLCDIRGFEDLIFDMADDEPNLHQLIAMIEEFNLDLVCKYLEAGAEVIGYPEDLGMQNAPMISPQYFRQFIKPSYQRIMAPTRKKGAIISMHSDGHLHELMDDILDCGVNVINLQDLVNGVDWIADRLAGRVCIDLDVDRQFVTPNGSPAEIDTLIRSEVEKIGRKEGGLLLGYGLYPGVPRENVKAVMDAMEKYSFYYSGN